MDQKIAYEAHPVTPGRKAELRARGLKIIDARFAPDDIKPATSDTPSKSDIATMKKADVKGWLEARGVSNPKGSVADLRGQLRAVMFSGDDQ
jgi:hypothetical protein